MCKVHLICVQLCATMKVICVQLTGRRVADQLSPLSPTFPPPPSHKNARSALTRQLLLLNFCDPPWRPPIGHWLRMAGCSDNDNVQSPLSSPSLAGFPRKAPEQTSTAALCTLDLLFLILCLGFSITFFLYLSYFFIYVFAWFILTCFHNFSAPCTLHKSHGGELGILHKKTNFGCNCKNGSLLYPLACYTHCLDYQTNILS